MDLTDLVRTYLNQPYPLWKGEVTERLVNHKWGELRRYNKILGVDDYSTVRCIENAASPIEGRFRIPGTSGDKTIYLESPSFDLLPSFYEEHGLIPLKESDFEPNEVLSKLNKAMGMLALVKPAQACVVNLVRAIQVLKPEDFETDVSYSHPKIPFSIFVSLCDDDFDISNLRVAESILHEAMHLKLTLIENVLPLVKPFTGNLYYSPWRDEGRPAQGVLHGLFVFRSIYDFYHEIFEENKFNTKTVRFLTDRLKNIRNELVTLKEFPQNFDLTEEGKMLSCQMLKSLLDYEIIGRC